jgi:membrane-associated protease RseP (regulator of RpoE activity)
MAKADQRGGSPNILVVMFIGAALLFGALVFVVARQLNFETPASHHAKSLLKLDSMLGATLEPLDARAAETLGGGSRVDEMVVTSVASDGRASAAGLRVGDVVEKVDGKDPQNIDDAIDAVSTDPTRIVVNRNGSRLMLNIPREGAGSRA